MKLKLIMSNKKIVKLLFYINLFTYVHIFLASVHSLATPVGSLVSGPISDKFGRRKALLFTILPLFAGWSLIASASSHAIILLGRVVAGIAVGLTAAPAQVSKKTTYYTYTFLGKTFCSLN